MDPITQQTVLAAAGAGGDKIYVDDVFNPYLYTGNGGNQSINTGIDLAGEGGLLWIKRRTAGEHNLYDTERGATHYLNTRSMYGQATHTNGMTSFDSNGFTVGNEADNNASNRDFVAWSFRKAPGFFDIITWNGNGSGDFNIGHNLESIPGCVIVKRTSSGTMDWGVYHRSLGTVQTQGLSLNTTRGAGNGNNVGPIRSTPTSTQLYVRGEYNTSGHTYVAYIFAHDEPIFGTDGDESIIYCGTYTGNNNYRNDINIGFEPQYVMIKCTSNDLRDWFIFDSMREAVPAGNQSRGLKTNDNGGEAGSAAGFYSQGITLSGGSSEINTSGQQYIYMAIRRPNKPKTAGSLLYKAIYKPGGGSSQVFQSTGFTTDMVFVRKDISYQDYTGIFSRITGSNFLKTTSSTSSANSQFKWDYQFGFQQDFANDPMLHHAFARAPGFLDVLTYMGNGANNHQITHNLSVPPELLIIKNRDDTEGWFVATQFTATNFARGSLNLINGFAATNPYGNGYRLQSQPDASKLYLTDWGDTNKVNNEYMAYMFASLPGASKIGTYSGTGNALNIDCGFTNGARFIMIKRMNDTGGWYIWDHARGIVNGDDSYYELDGGVAEVTNTDYVDPLSTGFTVTASAPTQLNTSGGTYLFLAIA